MKNKYFANVNFWARELKLPLFWMTDPHHEIFRQGVLVLYKNNVIHAFHLDRREVKAAEKGFEFFIKKSNIIKYKEQVELIRIMIERVVSAYKDIKISRLTDDELNGRVFKMIGVLNSYSKIYARTEPFVLAKIEANEAKYRSLIKELGQLRFIMREEGEALFYNLLGVLLKEAARRYKIKLNDLFFYKYDELRKLLAGRKVGRKAVADRKKGYALICVESRKIVFTGVRFRKLFQEIISAKKNKELSGQTARRGKVCGRVRVILHNKRNIAKDIAKFKKGEILVTEMTRPDTVLACRKAAAIITDEGGLTSHAAIIARELKIPCVIGTKIATQVLKDGDLVEVDAERGIVRILSKSKEAARRPVSRPITTL